MLKNAHIFVFLLIIAIIHCTPVPLTFGIVQSSYVDTSSEIEYSIQYNSSNYISVSAFALASYNSTYDITFCVGTEPNPTPTTPGSLVGCTSDGEESIIVPPQANSTIYVAIGTKSPTPLMFSVSSSLILDALSSDYQVSAGKYYITGTVSSGMRQYYMYKPTSSDQQIQIEVCSSVDLKGNNNAIRGAVLFNRTSDLWTVYNQTYADYPCGTPGTNGNIKVFDPSSDNYNSYLQICPTYIVTKGPITSDTFIGIDILRFWSFPQLNGTLNYRINIDTTYSTYLPLHPAAKGNPDYVYTANFSIARSSDSAVVSFEVVSSTSGPPITDIQYALFSDYSLSSQVKQYIQSNSSMASSCFLIGHESSMMVSSWVTSDQLVAGSGSLATFTIDDFYDDYEGTFDINLVAYSPTHGSFAYTYQSINSSESDDDGMGFWSWFFIVVGSILGLLAILLVLGVIGYFAYMKYRNRSKYELL